MRCVFYFWFALFCLDPTFGYHSVSVYNYALKGGIFSRFLKQDWLSCIIACARNDKCISYNYKIWSSNEQRSSFGGICELSEFGFPASRDSNERAKDLVFANGWVFQQTRHYKVTKIDIL